MDHPAYHVLNKQRKTQVQTDCIDLNSERYLSAMSVFQNTRAENPICHELIQAAFPKRNKQMHKGDCGRLVVCAGSVGLTGAGILSCRAALRSGCGLVTLGCAKSLNAIFEVALTEAMTLPLADKDGILLPSASEPLLQKLANANALLFGPGLSGSPSVTELAEALLDGLKIPTVIDADGLNAVSKNKKILKTCTAPMILTPHIGEFARLCDMDIPATLQDRKKLALQFAKEHHVIVVLKSHQTIVALPSGDCYENVLGNPGMATGGSGDVLSGLIASLLAQGNTPECSALAGVYIHSLAADMAVSDKGEYGLLPSDIVDTIPYAIRETAKRI